MVCWIEHHQAVPSTFKIKQSMMFLLFFLCLLKYRVSVLGNAKLRMWFRSNPGKGTANGNTGGQTDMCQLCVSFRKGKKKFLAKSRILRQQIPQHPVVPFMKRYYGRTRIFSARLEEQPTNPNGGFPFAQSVSVRSPSSHWEVAVT